MPTYEYACASCDNRYEKREGFDARPRQKCPKCGKMAQRLLSTPAVVFKGSGFYKTDSRGAASGDSSSAGSASEKPAGAPSETPAAATGGAGHTHGPGGHSHDAPAPAPASGAADTTKTTTTTTEKPSAK